MPKLKNGKAQKPVEQVEEETPTGKPLPTLATVVSEAIQLRIETYQTPKHMWARLTPHGTVQLGVSDHFTRELRGVVYVATDPIGDAVTKDQPFGVVETIGGWPFVIHDLYSPIAGEIIKVNQEVVDDAYVLNDAPSKWIVEIQPTSPDAKKELDALLRS